MCVRTLRTSVVDPVERDARRGLPGLNLMLVDQTIIVSRSSPPRHARDQKVGVKSTPMVLVLFNYSAKGQRIFNRL